jgi:DNA-binding CsgD family transcriptional regulator
MPRHFTAIIGDVVSSAKIKDLEDFLNRLNKILGQVNIDFADDIYAPLTLTRGDEVSGVLTRIVNIYRIVNTIFEAVHPDLMRFAIVYGPLEMTLKSRDAERISGTAFRQAAEILYSQKPKNLIALQINNSLTDRLLSSHMNLIFFLKRQWTKRQLEVITLYKKLENQKEVAKRLKITQPTVSTILQTANYNEISKAEQTINEALKEYQTLLKADKT